MHVLPLRLWPGSGDFEIRQTGRWCNAPMRKSCFERPHMQFQLMAVRIETIERCAFASVCLPQLHMAFELCSQKREAFFIERESQMGVVIAGLDRRSFGEFQTKPE